MFCTTDPYVSSGHAPARIPSGMRLRRIASYWWLWVVMNPGITIVPEQSTTSASPGAISGAIALIVLPSIITSALAKSPTLRSRLSTTPPRRRMRRFRASPTRFCSSRGGVDRKSPRGAWLVVAGAVLPPDARHATAPTVPASPTAPDFKKSRLEELLIIGDCLPNDPNDLNSRYSAPLSGPLRCAARISDCNSGTPALEGSHRRCRHPARRVHRVPELSSDPHGDPKT